MNYYLRIDFRTSGARGHCLSQTHQILIHT